MWWAGQYGKRRALPAALQSVDEAEDSSRFGVVKGKFAEPVELAIEDVFR